jgi:hypothetical protein
VLQKAHQNWSFVSIVKRSVNVLSIKYDVSNLFDNSKELFYRSVAQFGRASVSKTEGWGFDSLLTCFISKLIETSYRMELK